MRDDLVIIRSNEQQEHMFKYNYPESLVSIVALWFTSGNYIQL